MKGQMSNEDTNTEVQASLDNKMPILGIKIANLFYFITILKS